MFGSKGIVVKCTAAIFFRTEDWGKRTELLLPWRDLMMADLWKILLWHSGPAWMLVSMNFLYPFSLLQFEFSASGTPEDPGSLSMVGQKPVILFRHSHLKSAFSLSESLNWLNIQQHTILLLVENLYIACSLRKQHPQRNSRERPLFWLVDYTGGSTRLDLTIRLPLSELYGTTWMYNHGWGTFARLLKYGAVYSLMK